MYRLVRKFRARVKTRELVLLCGAFIIAYISGGRAVEWYNTAGRELRLVSSINGTDSRQAIAAAAESGREGEAKPDSFNLFAERDGAAESPNNSPPNSRLLQSDNNYSASYLNLQGGIFTPLLENAAANGQNTANGKNTADGQAAQNGNASANGQTAVDGVSEELFRFQDVPAGAVTDEAGPANADGDEKPAAAAEPADVPAAEPEQPLYTVKVIYLGVRHELKTTGKKVSDLFEEQGFTITKDDKISGAYLDGTINSDLFIEVKRLTQKTVVEEIKIPAKTVYRENNDIANGKSKTIRSAVDGKKRVEYLITYENGVQTGKKTVKNEVVAEAVSGIIEIGSSGTRKGKGGVEFTYKRVIDVKCTAYTSSYEDTGKRPGDPAFGITKLGMVAREGIVAVDPKVIPLGTKMYIEILDDKYEDYGIAIAGDTGSKIIGKKVDLYFDMTREELLKFGVRKAKVYIID